MKRSNCFHAFLLLIVIVVTIGQPLSRSWAEENPNAKDGKPAATEEQKTSLIQIYSWATILPKELIDLQSNLAKEQDVKMVEEELATLAKEAEELKKEVAIVGKNSDLQRSQITSYQNRVYKITSRLKNLSEPITSAISDLSAKRKDWQAKKDQITGYDKKEMLALALAKEQQKTLVETVQKAQQLIEEQLKLVLGTGKKIGNLQILLYSVNMDLQAMDGALRSTSIRQTSPSMLSREFYTRINGQLFWQSYTNTKRFIVDQLENLKNHVTLFFLSLCAFFLVYIGMHKSRELVSQTSRWYPFAVYPLATTVFMATSFNAFINMMPVDFNLPQQWEALLHILTMLAAIRLTTHLIENKLRRQLLIRLIIFMAVSMIMVVLNFPQVLSLLYVFYVSLLALFYYFYQLPDVRGKTDLKAWMRRTMGIIPAVVLLAGISGYDQFAVILFFDPALSRYQLSNGVDALPAAFRFP